MMLDGDRDDDSLALNVIRSASGAPSSSSITGQKLEGFCAIFGGSSFGPYCEEISESFSSSLLSHIEHGDSSSTVP